jgi:hypothetical protein
MRHNTILSACICLAIGGFLSSSPLHLEADPSAPLVEPGGHITIDAYLFNDGSTTEPGTLTIDSPPSFFPLDPVAIAGDIAPGHALHLRVRYQAAKDIPLGYARWIVRGGGQAVVVVVAIGTVESAPPVGKRVWLALMRA